MNAADNNEASEIELLLPWHAAGTLSVRDAQRVEAALADDPELARRYESVREELGQTIELNESLGAPSARVMADLFAKIDAEPARRPALSVTLATRVREFFASRSPRTLAWSAGAAAFAIVLQAGVIAGVLLKEHAGNRTESFETASALMSAPGSGTYAMIRFQPHANAGDITQFLETNELSITGGPVAGGLYRVMVASTKLQRDALIDRIKKLQQDKVVGFIAAQTE
jgi:anti-sigma-K factor RskA